MTTISFKAKLTEIGTATIIRLPKSASMRLPSRGVIMVEETNQWTQFSTQTRAGWQWYSFF
jgi:hypothetical protein